MANDYKVFDADGHVYELETDLLEYLDPPYRGRRELLRQPLFPTGDGWHRTARRVGAGAKALVAEDITAEVWIRALDETGMDGSVLFPTRGLHISMISNPEWAVALARGYNNWLSERFLKVSPRLKGIAVLPLQSPSEAVEELKRAVHQLGMVGGLLPGAGLKKFLGDPCYYPVYEAAQDLDTMLAVHAGFAPKGLELDFDAFDRLIYHECLVHPVTQMVQFTHLILSGVFDRFTRLRVAFMEAGVAWVLGIMERIEHEWNERSRIELGLKTAPKEQLASGRLFFEANLEDVYLPYVVKELGDRVLVYSSDFPHFTQTSALSEGVEVFRKRPDLSEETKKRILGENARNLYRLD
jgi:uncharacterized protein